MRLPLMGERLNAAVSKTVVPRKRYRGFESPPLRSRKPRIACRDPAREVGFSPLSGEFGGELGGKLNSTHRSPAEANTPNKRPAGFPPRLKKCRRDRARGADAWRTEGPVSVTTASGMEMPSVCLSSRIQWPVVFLGPPVRERMWIHPISRSSNAGNQEEM